MGMRYSQQEWRIRAVLDDHLMDLSVPYWEGAVDVQNLEGTVVGRGILEMVRQ